MAIFSKLFGTGGAAKGDRTEDAIAKGDAARDRQDWAAAADAYGAALKLAPGLTAIHVQHGHALKECGRVEEAVDAYQTAADADPDDADSRIHLAHALKGLGRAPEAIAVFREAIELNPADRESADEIFYLTNVPDPVAPVEAAPDAPPPAVTLDDMVAEIQPGLSVVTSARNRTENLLRALPTWLACPEVGEVIIVDWTSDEPVFDALQAADLSDPRIRVLRIEGEPRWVLSAAFNAGFRLAAFDRIMKVDADIVLKDGFFAGNTLETGCFLAGNWRDAEPGQEFINGFFLVHRADLMEVNGFSELITTYGWDDDDIYDRLEGAKLRRVGVDPATITHLPHDDTARLELKTTAFASAHAQFWNRTSTKINANRIMSFLMPKWRKHMTLQPFVVEQSEDGLVVARRSAPPPHTVPDLVRRDVEHYATVEYLSGLVGARAYKLSREQVDTLMSTASLEAITPLAISIAARRADRISHTGNYLIVSIDEEVRQDHGILVEGLTALDARAQEAGFALVALDAEAAALNAALADMTPVPFVAKAPGAASVSVEDLPALDGAGIAQGECRECRLSAGSAPATPPAATSSDAPPDATPSLSVKRDTLYIDAQHGLGNRLRAIASAAAIADRTNRDLVIVWEPDHHCECDLADLFDYTGPVIKTSFPGDARDTGLSVFNYMEIEEGSNRGAPLALTPGVSAYARSAYVLNHPHSDWDAENAFLRGLTPTGAVADLVQSVRAPNDIGVHVRMEAGPGLDGNSYDSPENWPDADHQTLQKWRAKSHFSNFITHLDKLVDQGGAETIFLAADLPETYEVFAETYGDRVAYLNRALYDRSREQMYYALADAILLSRSNAMLGSAWSSFSEIALRLSQTFDRIQLSGEDF